MSSWDINHIIFMHFDLLTSKNTRSAVSQSQNLYSTIKSIRVMLNYYVLPFRLSTQFN